MAKAKKMAAVPQVESGAEMLTSQYEKVESAKGTFVREAVRFGAMLIEVEASLSAVADKLISKRGRVGEGRPNCGLESWLAENCPSINYKTAMGYKAMAGKVSAMLGGGDVAVAALVENSGYKNQEGEVIEVPDEVAEKRDELFGEIGSRRQLEQMYFEFSAQAEHGASCGKAGRPKAEAAPLLTLKKSDEAKAIWAGVMKVLDKTAVMDAVPLLDAKVTEVCLGRVGDLYNALKAHSNEF